MIIAARTLPPRSTEGMKAAAMDPDAKEMLKAASRYSYLGIFFGVAVVIGWAAGNWADGRLYTRPWLTIVGLIVGVVSGFRELYRLARRGMKDEQ